MQFFITSLASLNINNSELQNAASTTTPSTRSEFYPPRYVRYLFLFFSKNVTQDFYNTILHQLITFDSYCGGENIEIQLVFGDGGFSSDNQFLTLEEAVFNFNCAADTQLTYCYNSSISQNVPQGSIAYDNVTYVSTTLINFTNNIRTDPFSNNKSITQVILITDYIAASIGSANTISILSALKIQKDVSFIALLTNFTNEIIVNSYFPPQSMEYVFKFFGLDT